MIIIIMIVFVHPEANKEYFLSCINEIYVAIKDLFSLLIGVFITFFSIYFTYQKLGNKVFISYSTMKGPATERRNDNISLINRKNKPVVIFSIQAVLKGKTLIEVEEFKSPKILKPLESLHIATTPFSFLMLDSQKFEEDYHIRDIELYLVTQESKIKCKIINPPKLNKDLLFNKLQNTNKRSWLFGDRAYNEQVRFAITYYSNKTETVFVYMSGFTDGSAPFSNTIIPESDMVSHHTVKAFLLKQYPIPENQLYVDELNDSKPV